MQTQPIRTWQSVLGVACDSSEQQLRAAYLRLVKECHPDRNNGYRAEWDRVSTAYQQALQDLYPCSSYTCSN